MLVLGLGSNCGDRLSYLRQAIHYLKSPLISPGIEVQGISPIYESEALLPEGAPTDWNQPFLNLNLLCKTDLPALEVLKQIKGVENRVGRLKRGRWAPREIDIDILAIGDLVFESEELKVPHSSLMDRPFALLPFADLLPQWKWPKQGPFFGTPLSEIVSEWKRKSSDQVPFRTQRSQFFLTQLVGILNITPDSFSDGGLFNQPKAALDRAQELFQQGANIIDIGAESTRPGAPSLSFEDEWKRLSPVLEVLCSSKSKAQPFQISVDTRHAEVATRAIQMGVDWINDVTGFDDIGMRKAVANSDVQIVVMHSLTVPPSKNAVLSLQSDPLELVLEWGKKRIQELTELGISEDRIIFDPGIGFGKTIEQSWEIFRRIQEFQALGVKILVGHSRKSFLSSLTPRPFQDRDVETLAVSAELLSLGVDYLRIHNADFHTRSFKVWTQVNGIIRCRA